MGRNPKIKLFTNKKQLNRLVNCSICCKSDKYKNLYFYIDESNISITNNSKGICKSCKDEINKPYAPMEGAELKALIKAYNKQKGMDSNDIL
jgi:hypothetical protein